MTAPLIGGPLHGGHVRLLPGTGRHIVLAHGMTDDEPWPHEWLDYHRQPDGTYRWVQHNREAS